tara:strand:+ start:104648 stop:105325 length:678 start_codon:yes stop_codon:yes gene_type:complete
MNNTAQQLPAETAENLTEQSILDYLGVHKDFFLRHSDILEKMTLPTSIDGNIASFNDFQNRKLANKITKLEERNKRLIATAIQNIESSTKINQLTLSLLHSTSKEMMMNHFREVIQNDLELDSAQVLLKSDESLSYQNIYDKSFTETKDVCLRTATEESPCLHESSDVCIRSEALIKLKNKNGDNFAVLTLGSRDIQRFHEGQGTELLEFLGEVISYKLEIFMQR